MSTYAAPVNTVCESVAERACETEVRAHGLPVTRQRQEEHRTAKGPRRQSASQNRA